MISAVTKIMLLELKFDPDLAPWFVNGFRMGVESGNRALFWKDIWLGEVPLCLCFLKLFRKNTNANYCVGQQGNWFNNAWGWNLTWKRNLLPREVSELRELETLINSFSPMLRVRDE